MSSSLLFLDSSIIPTYFVHRKWMGMLETAKSSGGTLSLPCLLKDNSEVTEENALVGAGADVLVNAPEVYLRCRK